MLALVSIALILHRNKFLWQLIWSRMWLIFASKMVLLFACKFFVKTGILNDTKVHNTALSKKSSGHKILCNGTQFNSGS